MTLPSLWERAGVKLLFVSVQIIIDNKLLIY